MHAFVAEVCANLYENNIPRSEYFLEHGLEEDTNLYIPFQCFIIHTCLYPKGNNMLKR